MSERDIALTGGPWKEIYRLRIRIQELEEQLLINECNHESEQLWIETTNDLKARIQEGEETAQFYKAEADSAQVALEKREVMHMNALAIISGLQAVVEAARSVLAVETVGDPNDEEQWDDLIAALNTLDGDETVTTPPQHPSQ